MSELLRLTTADKTVVPAADVSVARYKELLEGVKGVPGIEFVKVGFSLGYRITLATTAELAHQAGLKVVFDHQKGGTDVPDTAPEFADVCAEAKVDAAIIFPQSGPVTGEAWIKALQDKGIPVIVGGEMTHEGYKKSEGGFIDDEALPEMYRVGLDKGVRSFVVPGNRVARVAIYKAMFDEALGEGNYDVWSPGFIAQGGVIADFAKDAGPRWHAITGRAITTATDIRQAALQMTSQIR